MHLNRREMLKLGAVSAAALSLGGAEAAALSEEVLASLVASHDEALGALMERQVRDPESPWRGAAPDSHELYTAHSAANILHHCAGAYYHPLSAWHQSPDVLERMRLAAGFLERAQSEDGNIDLLTTNFNSPPDTAFVVHRVGTAANLARIHDDNEVVLLLRDFLRRAGGGMARGGIHTPNHRWVLCAALAQVNELFPERAIVDRIDEWLAEGIDIDEEGQYIERSTGTYNGHVNRALVVMATKLNRPELLEPVRANLDAMTYLVHPNGEVVTEISSRQDARQRRDMGDYWFALRYMAIHDNNGQYAAMLAPLEPRRIELPALLEYPEILEPLPAPQPLPDTFTRDYPLSEMTRIRKGRLSAVLMRGRQSPRLVMHAGEAVVEGIRFASAYFGRGEFLPREVEQRPGGLHFRQELSGQYFQPLSGTDLVPITRENWGLSRPRRETSEECAMVYEAGIRETQNGFEVRIAASGTDTVPLAIEIALRPGGTLEGVAAAPGVANGFLLREGYATYTVGNDVLRIGPGKAEHAYTQVRGASGRLSGMSLYLTGYTPFEHTFSIEIG